MKRTNVYLSDIQLTKLAALSQYQGVSKSELIRSAINNFIEANKKILKLGNKYGFIPEEQLGSAVKPGKLTKEDKINQRIEELRNQDVSPASIIDVYYDSKENTIYRVTTAGRTGEAVDY